jgi:hypothetical protein
MIVEHSNSDQGEGSSSGMAFLANMRTIHSPVGAPLTPVSDSERLAMQKYSPWPRGENFAEGAQRQHQERRNEDEFSDPAPADVEILLKTYWTSIHPVSCPSLAVAGNSCEISALADPV